MDRSTEDYYRRDPAASPRTAHVRRYPLRAVIDPEGTLWPSLYQAGRAYGLTAPAIRQRAEKRLAGWRFAEED
jgi:hypothetical protein